MPIPKAIIGSALVLFLLAGGTLFYGFIAAPTEQSKLETPNSNRAESIPPKNSDRVSSPVPSPATPKPAGLTLSAVAQHNSAESCYTVINGVVYDVTSFISKHPGGPQRILRLCGVDGTERFENQHGGETRPESLLAALKVGVLAR